MWTLDELMGEVHSRLPLSPGMTLEILYPAVTVRPGFGGVLCAARVGLDVPVPARVRYRGLMQARSQGAVLAEREVQLQALLLRIWPLGLPAYAQACFNLDGTLHDSQIRADADELTQQDERHLMHALRLARIGVTSFGGRPPATGIYTSREECWAGLLASLLELRRQKRPLTQAMLGKYLPTHTAARTIQKWLKQWEIEWADLVAEARRQA